MLLQQEKYFGLVVSDIIYTGIILFLNYRYRYDCT